MLRRLGLFKITISLLLLFMGFTLIWAKMSSAVPASQYNFFCSFTILGRHGCNGLYNNNNYFDNDPSSATVVKGNDVMDPYPGHGDALPDGVIHDAASFESVLETYLALTKGGTKYDWNGAAAAFIIDSMLGKTGASLGSWQNAVKFANANLTTGLNWEYKVNTYDANGWIDWDNVQTIPIGTPDSTHVCNDDASAKCEYWPGPGLSPYDEFDYSFRGDNGSWTFDLITFHNPDGTTFNISRFCANLVGFIKPLVSTSDYTLAPTVTPYVNGVSTAVAQPGDTVVFKYVQVANSGAKSLPTDCTGYDNNYVGYHVVGSPPDKGAPVSLCSARLFAKKTTTTLPSYTVPAAAVKVNETVCSSLYVNPGSVSKGLTGPATSDEACVIIGDEPYTRVFGGDVSAGNAQPAATCTAANDWDSGIVGWNTASGLYNGAGTQLAAFAIGEIVHFATSQTNSGATNGVAPSGIAFANTTTGAGGIYGGSLGGSALPCENEYYIVPTAHTNLTVSPIDVSTLGSGAYVWTGASNPTIYSSAGLASGVTPQRIQLFVPNHDVYISGKINYQGGWGSVDQIPMFELVTKGNAAGGGNIYISNVATQLDGTYVAEDSLGTGLGNGGQIATCSNAAGTAPAPTGSVGSTLYTNCNNQLTVNGALVGEEVVFERSVNSLNDSSADNPGSLSSKAAEQFNYNPSLWLVQPPSTPGALIYNTVVALPPVL